MKVKGSRFIGYIVPCDSESSALEFIHDTSKTHYDATHNCFAFRLWHELSPMFRYSDDGEPSGTAGRPILDALENRNFYNIACVVTRYFGGTKLGTGGLARAYRQCAEETLAGCTEKTIWITKTIRIQFHYDLTGAIMSYISQHPIKIVESIYQEDTQLILSVRQSQVESASKDLIELSAGKIILEGINE